MKKLATLNIVAMLLALVAPFVVAKPARAANFTEASMRLARMKASTTDVNILVVAKPATTATEDAVKVTFGSGFTVDTTAANITVSTSGLPSTYQGESLAAWPGVGSAASGVSGQEVSFASGDLTVGTLYGFFITAGIDNPSSAGEYENTVATQASAANVDVSNVAVRIISDDQVVITATVPPTFSFSLGANSDSFTSDLSSSSVVSTNGVAVTVATNASNGWVAWLKSANTSLDSATTGETIETVGSVDDSPTTLTAGSDGYVLDVDLTTDSSTGDGTVTVDAEYNGTTTSQGGTLSSSLEEVAVSNGTTDGDVITLVARAAISAVKAAADDYTDTWTVVGAGNF
jgi:hypothetical protein